MKNNNKTVDRRTFLKETAVAAAAFSMTLALDRETELAEAASIPANTEEVTCALIGSGAQGRNILRNTLRVPNVRVKAICDIFPPNLQKGLDLVKKANQNAKPYEDYRKLLEKEDVQAVLIATPIFLHAEMAIAALRAGKHVFSEKAMAYSIEQCQAMTRTVKETGKFLQIGHQRRYNETYNHAYRLINKDKVLGKVTHVRAQWHRNNSWRRPIPKKIGNFDPKKYGYKDMEHLVNWRLYKATSAGLMAELGSHQVDVANWFLNSPPTSVIGMGGIDYWKDGREVWDNVNVIYEYPKGVKFMYSSITTNAFDGYFEQFMGDKGTLIIAGGKGLLFRERRAEELEWAKKAHTEKFRGKTAIILDAGASTREEAAKRGKAKAIGGKKARKSDYLLEIENFFHCIREGKKPFCDAEVGMKSAISILKANEAMEKRTLVQLNDELFKV